MNKLNNAIKDLESKGYTVKHNVTNTILIIEKKVGLHETMVMNLTPVLSNKETINDIINKNIKDISFKFYGYSTIFPNSSDLVKAIEKEF